MIQPDPRPADCRNRLRDSGKPYPKSGCQHCKTGGMTGCPYEGGAAISSPPPASQPSPSDWGRTRAWEIVRERRNALQERRQHLMHGVYALRTKVEILKVQSKALQDSASALSSSGVPIDSVSEQARLKQNEYVSTLARLNSLEREWDLVNKCMEQLDCIHDAFFCLMPAEQQLERFDRERAETSPDYCPELES